MSNLKSIIREVVLECIEENKKPPTLSKLNPSIVQPQVDKKMKKAPGLPSPIKKANESGLTSEDENGEVDDESPKYDEQEEIRLIKGLHLITKKLLSMHNVSDDKEDSDVDAGSPDPAEPEESGEFDENHKVQARSQVTSKDGPQIPKNVRNPKTPST